MPRWEIDVFAICSLTLVWCLFVPFANSQMIVHPPSSASESTICDREHDLYVADVLNQCKTYLRCHHGKPIWAQCPAGTSFDDVTRSCVDVRVSTCALPENQDDNVDDSNASDAPTGEERSDSFAIKLPNSRYDDNCRGMSDGFHADRTAACTKYFECRDGSLARWLSCPPGTAFDMTRSQCVPALYAVCLSKPTLNRFAAAAMTSSSANSGHQQPEVLWRRLMSKRQIKFGTRSIAPGLLTAMGEVLEQLGENMQRM